MAVLATSSANPDASVSRVLVPVLTLAVGVNILCSRALAVFLPVVAADLGTTVSLLGQVPALTLLLAGVLALVVGPLADRYGFRRMLVIGVVSVVLSAAATGLAPNFPILLIVTLVGAVARASVLPTAQAVVATVFEHEGNRRRAMGWVTAGLSTATILGIPVMTVIAGVSSWRVSFFVLGALALVAAILIQRNLAETPRDTSTPLGIRGLIDAYRPVWRHRPTACIILASLTADMGVWCAMTYLAAFFVQQHGFTIDEVGWVFLALGLLTLSAAVLAGGRLGARPLPMLLGGRAACAVLLAAVMILPVSWPVCVVLILLYAPTSGITDMGTTLALMNVSPAGRATTMTLRSAAVCVGMALGSTCGGILLAVSGYPALGAFTFALVATSTVLVWIASRDHARQMVAAPAGAS